MAASLRPMTHLDNVDRRLSVSLQDVGTWICSDTPSTVHDGRDIGDGRLRSTSYRRFRCRRFSCLLAFAGCWGELDHRHVVAQYHRLFQHTDVVATMTTTTARMMMSPCPMFRDASYSHHMRMTQKNQHGHNADTAADNNNNDNTHGRTRSAGCMAPRGWYPETKELKPK